MCLLFLLIQTFYILDFNMILCKASDGCETFNALQKQGGQSKKIDQTGIFGCACSRHGYPVSLVDMYTPGEQLSFKIVLLLILCALLTI